MQFQKITSDLLEVIETYLTISKLTICQFVHLEIELDLSFVEVVQLVLFKLIREHSCNQLTNNKTKGRQN